LPTTRDGEDVAPLLVLPVLAVPVEEPALLDALFVFGTQTAPMPRTAERASITLETDFGPFTVSPWRLMVPM
jgi:hypothetical protein